MDLPLDAIAIKKEKGPLDKFKNQSTIINIYGNTGLRIYLWIDNQTTIGELMERAQLPKEKFLEIMWFMIDSGIVTLSYKTSAVESKLPEATRPPIASYPPTQEKQRTTEPPKPAEKIEPPHPAQLPEVERTPRLPPQPHVSQETPPSITESVPAPPEKQVSKPAHKEKGTVIPPAPMPKPIAGLERFPAGESEVAPKTTPSNVENGTPQHVSKELYEAPKFENPLEEKIYQKFGPIGVKVYNAIDGEKTAQEILKETKITEEYLVEILEFLNDEGIIRLEVEEETPQEKPKEITALGGEAEPIKPIHKPIKRPMSVLNEAMVKADLMLKFKGSAKVYSAIDGKRNILHISRETGVPITEIDNIMKYLVEKGAITLEPLTPHEIQYLYGHEGLKIYSTYGRDGIVLYELIDSKASIKDIVMQTGIEPEKAIDIFLFIHRLLGIEMPITREMLMRQFKEAILTSEQ
ncbi:MAG: hypothetical protein QXP42_02320 [Candidatus Micrarchaeia archaeon]